MLKGGQYQRYRPSCFFILGRGSLICSSIAINVLQYTP